MHKLYQILWSLAILLIIVTTVIFSFGFILVIAAVVSILGIYRYFLLKKSPKEFKTKPYTYVEIIDVKSEVIHERVEPRKPDQLNPK